MADDDHISLIIPGVDLHIKEQPVRFVKVTGLHIDMRASDSGKMDSHGSVMAVTGNLCLFQQLDGKGRIDLVRENLRSFQLVSYSDSAFFIYDSIPPPLTGGIN